MARPREFDMDQAVAAATGVFWQRGYEGAALPDLTQGMGISRGSLYKAFGSKNALFVAALARYDRDAVSPAVELLLERSRGGAERIAAVFRAAADAARAGDRRGCLLCNTAVEAGTSPEIRAAIGAMLGRIKDAFATALEALVLDPEIRRGRARALTSAYIGLRVMARGGEEQPVLDAVAREAPRLATLR